MKNLNCIELDKAKTMSELNSLKADLMIIMEIYRSYFNID